MRGDFDRFREAVLSHPEALDALMACESVEAFLEVAVRFAAVVGPVPSRDELEEALRAARRDHVERWLR